MNEIVLEIKGISKSYGKKEVLNNINLSIERGKIIGLLGPNGSGKTTLIKLLQGFYEPNKGNIKIGETPLSMINPHLWRGKTGSVMQDGYIFSDTIAKNIAVRTDEVDKERLRHAVKTANIQEFINSLPLGYNT